MSVFLSQEITAGISFCNNLRKSRYREHVQYRNCVRKCQGTDVQKPL